MKHIAIIGFLVVLAGCNLLAPNTQQSSQDEPTATPAAANMQEADQPTAVAEDTPQNSNQATTADNPYQPYSSAAVTSAAQDGQALLFFHADWCPTCRAAEAEFQQNPDQIPAGVTIFKTNFDTASELKEQYQIVAQHTFVQVDAEGNEITKWSGGGIQSIKDNIQAS